MAGLVNAYIDRLMREIEPALRERFGQRSDADSIPVPKIGGQVALGQQFLETTFRMVDQQAADDLARVVPVPSTAVLPNARKLEREFIQANTELIRLEASARAEVREVITGPLREGIRVEEVRAKIEERLGVVRSRAELIARDQTLKLYGQIQEARQTAAGIVEYTWSTSEDERVRSRHQELEGTTQRWDSPPIVDKKTGRRAHPGNDFQCRCAAIPILPAEGLEEQESPPEPQPILPPEREPPRAQAAPPPPAPPPPPPPPPPAAPPPPPPPAPPSEPPRPPEPPERTVARAARELPAIDVSATPDAPREFIVRRRDEATAAYEALPAPQKQAVDAFVRHDYKVIRALQAGVTPEEIAETLGELGALHVRKLQRLLEPLRIAQETTLRVDNPVATAPLWRGLRLTSDKLAELLTKNTLTLGHGTTSTTYDISTALRFSVARGSEHRVVLKITELSSAATAMYRSNPHVRENEMLVDGRKFNVVDRKYDREQDVYVVELKEAPKSDRRDALDAAKKRARDLLLDDTDSRFASDGSDITFEP